MDMLFLKQNSVLPRGEVTSTARKGDKWFKQVSVGDVLTLKVTESGEVLGRAAVIAADETTFGHVIRKAYQNHAAKGMTTVLDERRAVESSIRAAYPDSKDEDVFSIVHFLILNDEPSVSGVETHADAVPRFQGKSPILGMPYGGEPRYADGAAAFKPTQNVTLGL